MWLGNLHVLRSRLRAQRGPNDPNFKTFDDFRSHGSGLITVFGGWYPIGSVQKFAPGASNCSEKLGHRMLQPMALPALPALPALQHCTCPEDLTTLHLLPGKATATPRGDSEFRRHGWNAVMLWACAARNSHLTLRWPETLTCAPESGMNMDIEAFKHFQTVQRCLMLPTQKAAAKMERESKRWKPSCQGRMLTLHTQDTS